MSVPISRKVLDELLRHDLAAFIHRSFQTVSPGEPYLDNWHMQAIAHRLRLCAEGRCRRLIITLPPRSGKSIAVSVAFVAWLLGRDPTRQVICASYSKDLANKHSRDCRAVMQTAWYHRAYPGTRLDPLKNTEDEFCTTARGFRLATSVGGTLTGLGGDVIVVDDALKPDEAYSETGRDKVNHWFVNTLLSRLNNKQDGVIIIVQQRLHENDLVGCLLSRNPDGWDHLNLPAVATSSERIAIGNDLYHLRDADDVLHRAREPKAKLDEMKAEVGSAVFAAQYQQSPLPPDGNMIKRDWFRSVEVHQMPERFDQIVQSWDTASKPSELNDYSVCTTWGIRGAQIHLLHVLRKRLNYPDLKRAVREQWQLHRAGVVLIEDKASGTQLIQELVQEGMHAVKAFEPEGDKVMRLHAQSATIENGFVHLPKEAPWRDDYLYELTIFPNGKFDDQVDSTSQALAWIKQSRWEPGITTYYRQLVEAKRAGAAAASPAR